MPSPYVLFCCDPENPRTVEPYFAVEVEIARKFGFTPIVIDHDVVDWRMDPVAALREARFDSDGSAVCCGLWLLPEDYAGLFDALSSRGIGLLTSPANHAACHYTPSWYPPLAKWLPLTKWLPVSQIDDRAAIEATLSAFGPIPVTVEDWVEYDGASDPSDGDLHILDASDFDEALKTIAHFREMKGERLMGGLVFRAYFRLQPMAGPPFVYCAFVVNGSVVGCWPCGEWAGDPGPPPAKLLADVAAHVPSPFAWVSFGIDMNGKWWPRYVGDGQACALVDGNADDVAPAVFSALSLAMR